MARPGLFVRVGGVWLRLLTRRWLGVSVFLAAIIAGAVMLALLR